MQSTHTFINYFFILILFLGQSHLVRFDVDPGSNSLRIQLDQPFPYMLTSPIKKDVSPVLTIGILTLDVGKGTSKILTSKYYNKIYNDFMFPEVPPTESGELEILDMLQNIDKHSMLVRSYSKFLTFYKNVYTVPLNIKSKTDYLLSLMDGLDGILFTGGASEFFVQEKIKIDSKKKNSTPKSPKERKNSVYLNTVIAIINKAKEINDSGRVFPIWGTCLGFEAMILSEAPNDFKFDSFKDVKKTHSIVLTDDSGAPLMNVINNPLALQNSNMKMSLQLGTQELDMTLVDHKLFNQRNSYSLPKYNSFQDFMRMEYYGKQKQNTFYFYHHYGFTTAKFNSSESLTSNYRIISVSDQNDFNSPSNEFTENNDKMIYAHSLISNIEEMTSQNDGETTFVSAIEHKKYPFYAVQFHPEKPLFDFTDNKSVRHDPLAMDDNRKFSSFFVQKLRAAKIANIENNKVQEDLSELMGSLIKIQVNHVGLYSEVIFFKQAMSID